jgi:hypothetical protein
MLLKKYSFSNPGLSAFLCLSLLVFCASVATAQSGRRLPKLSPKPQEKTPPKEATPEEDKPARPQNKEPLLQLTVVYQQASVMSPHFLTQAVMQGCLDRLQKSTDLKPQYGSEMNRKEASDIAKNSQNTYVLWLQLETDSFGPDTGRNSPQSYYVNYVLFTPGTGKGKTSGNVYQRQSGLGSIPRGDITGEYTLRRAGRDLADRVLGALNLPIPPDRF